MLAGIHFFVASALSANLAPGPLTAIFIGFASHHLLDRLPHADINIFDGKDLLRQQKNLKIWTLVIIEFIFFLLITFYFLGKHDLNFQKIAFLGGLGGIAPDILTIFFRQFFNKRPKIVQSYLNFHKNFHFNLVKRREIFLGFIIEILIFVFGLILLI